MAGTKIGTQDGVVPGCQCTLCTGFRGYRGIGVGLGAEWASEKQRFPLGQTRPRKERMTTELQYAMAQNGAHLHIYRQTMHKYVGPSSRR